MDTLEDALKELARNDGMENVYIEIPKIDLKKLLSAILKFIHDLVSGMNGWKNIRSLKKISLVLLTRVYQVQT